MVLDRMIPVKPLSLANPSQGNFQRAQPSLNDIPEPLNSEELNCSGEENLRDRDDGDFETDPLQVD